MKETSSYDEKNVDLIKKRPEIKQKFFNIDVNQIENDKFRRAVLKFSVMMVQNFSEYLLINFYNHFYF